MVFDKNWNRLGWSMGGVDFYEINYHYGGLANSIPAECYRALNGRMANATGDGRDVVWRLTKVDTGANTPAGTDHATVLQGGTGTGGNCAEYNIWQTVRGSASIQAMFARTQSLIIHGQLAPCLRCCHSLVGIAHQMDMNIFVHCRRDYDFVEVRKRADFTIMIPRKANILTTSNPARDDEVVYVLHDDTLDFSGRRTLASFKGTIAKNRYSQGTPHAPYGFTCPSLGINPDANPGTQAKGRYEKGRCTGSCGQTFEIESRAGSGFPWGTQAAEYDPIYLDGQKRDRNTTANPSTHGWPTT